MSYEGSQRSTILLIASVLVITGCARQPSASTSTSSTSTASRQASIAGSASTAQAIGTAKLEADGTLVVTLYTQGPIHAQLLTKYAKGDPEREKILEHIGGLAVGEEKLVPPWPDNIDDARVDAAVKAHIAKHSWGGSARIMITGTDKQGRIAVIAVATSAPSSGVSLLLDPNTYEVVDESPLKNLWFWASDC